MVFPVKGVSFSKASTSTASTSLRPVTFNARMNSNQPTVGGNGTRKRDSGHGSGSVLTGNRTHNWFWRRRVLEFSNKSHDRQGNTEMLFLGLPSHGNGMDHVRPASGR